jgi:hypothetical protein
MRTSTRLGRIAVFTCSAGLVSVLAMLPSGSAVAVVSGSFKSAGDSSSSPTGNNTCMLASGHPTSSSPVKPVSGGTVRASTTLKASYRSSTNSGDLTTVSGHYTGVVHVVKRHGDLSRLTLTGTGDLSIHRAKGKASHCRTTADVSSEIEPLSFTESHPGWFVASHVGTARSQIVELEVANSGDTSGVIVDTYEGGPASGSVRAFAKPGTYGTLMAVGVLSSGVLLKSADRTNVSLSFYRAGAAPVGTSGSGKRFVRFPASVSCNRHRARLTWTSKVRQVSSGSFLVNGHKLASVSNPHAGGHVALHHLSSRADTTITAKLSLKAGGHVSAARTYLPCKG